MSAMARDGASGAASIDLIDACPRWRSRLRHHCVDRRIGTPTPPLDCHGTAEVVASANHNTM
jgi:hypothetical protein